jgi:hypothetical protein
VTALGSSLEGVAEEGRETAGVLETLGDPETIKLDSSALDKVPGLVQLIVAGLVTLGPGAAAAAVGFGLVGAAAVAAAASAGGVTELGTDLEDAFKRGTESVSGFGSALESVGTASLKDFEGAAGLAGQAVGTLFVDLAPEIEKAAGYVDDLAGDFDKWAQSVNSSGLDDFMSKIFSEQTISELKTDLSDVLAIIEHIGQAIEDAPPAFGETLEAALNVLKSIPVPVIDALIDLFAAMKGASLIMGAANGINSLINSLGPEAAADTGASAAGEGASALGTAAEDAAGAGIGGAGAAAAGKLASGAAESAAKDAGTTIGDALAGAAEDAAGSALGNGVASAVGKVAGGAASGAAADVGKVIGDAVSDAAGDALGSGLGAAAGDAVGKMGSSAASAADSAGADVGEGFSQAAGDALGGGLGSAAESAVSDMGSSAAGAAGSAGTDVSQAFTESAADDLGGLGDAASAGASDMSEAAGAAGSAGTDVSQAFTGSVAEGVGGAGIGEVADEAGGEFEEAVPVATEAGQMASAGFASGIAVEGEAAEAAADAVVTEVDTTMIDGLEIASPSKKTRRYGQYWDQGLALGMRDGLGDVADAAGALVSTSAGALSGMAVSQSLGALGMSSVLPGVSSPLSGAPIQLQVTAGGTSDPLMNEIVSSLRFKVGSLTGGNVQAALGNG